MDRVEAGVVDAPSCRAGRMAVLAVLLTATACSPPDAPAASTEKDEAVPARVVAAAPADITPPAKAVPRLILDAEGLVLNDQPLRFGTARARAESLAGKVQGEIFSKGSSDECGAGTIDYTSYKDDLQLTFQDDKFVGWTINGAASPLKTAKGIGIGSPRQSLDAAYGDAKAEDSSLGLLFSAGGFVGILDQDGIDGIVTDIWAGTVCLID